MGKVQDDSTDEDDEDNGDEEGEEDSSEENNSDIESSGKKLVSTSLYENSTISNEAKCLSGIIILVRYLSTNSFTSNDILPP